MTFEIMRLLNSVEMMRIDPTSMFLNSFQFFTKVLRQSIVENWNSIVQHRSNYASYVNED